MNSKEEIMVEAIKLYSFHGPATIARLINRKYGLTKDTGWLTYKMIRDRVRELGIERSRDEAYALSSQTNAPGNRCSYPERF